MTNVASGDQEIVNSLIGNNNKKKSMESGGLGLLISKAHGGAYVAIVNHW